jgi:hypothetical protein
LRQYRMWTRWRGVNRNGGIEWDLDLSGYPNLLSWRRVSRVSTIHVPPTIILVHRSNVGHALESDALFRVTLATPLTARYRALDHRNLDIILTTQIGAGTSSTDGFLVLTSPTSETNQLRGPQVSINRCSNNTFDPEGRTTYAS